MRKLKFKSPIFVIIKLFERERERESNIESFCKKPL